MPVAPISDSAWKPLAYGADRITFGRSQEKRFLTVPVRPPNRLRSLVAPFGPSSFLSPGESRCVVR